MKLKLGGRLILAALILVPCGFALNWYLNKREAEAPIVADNSAFTSGSSVSAAAPAKLGDALKVSIVSFHGYAPGIVANGGSLETQNGSIYNRLGANIKFVIEDNVPPLAQTFKSASNCAWRTSDFWAQEQPNLRNAGMDGRAVMVVDNTQGGDAIIARDPSIRTVEDLAGKTIALLQFTPSHGMTIDAIANSSLTPKKKASIKYVYINADEGTSGVRAAFNSGKVDAAALWDPDLALALKAGGHVVYSTKTAQNLIYDVMVCDKRVLDNPNGRAQVAKFVEGWMEGVKAARGNRAGAVQALVNTQDMFKLLARDQGPKFIESLFDNVVWTGIEDNARILGLTGGTNHYERVYTQFDAIYREAGALANPQSPVIAAQNSFDYSFIKDLVATKGVAAAVEPTFTAQGLATAKIATVTKPVIIKFDVGSAELSARAKQIIDKDMVPFLENNGAAYVEISGNTDSTGDAASNRLLSQRRATTVVNYLKTQWEIPAARMRATGYGSERPICVEPGTNDGLTLDECRGLNRSTRIAILGN